MSNVIDILQRFLNTRFAECLHCKEERLCNCSSFLYNDPSTTQVAVLIKAMNRDFMAISDRMKVSDLKSRKRFRENYVTPALKDEAIERKYPNQPNHPKQQYRLTKKAQKWREKHT